MEEYVAWLHARGAAQRTVVQYVSVIRRWQHASADPVGAGHVEITEWLSSLGVGEESVRSYRKALRSWYQYLIWSGQLQADPTLWVPSPPARRGKPRPVPLGEVRKAIDAAKDHQLRSWLCLAALGGLRRSEISALEGRDIDVDWTVVRHGKGGRTRTVPTHPETWIAVNFVGWLPGRLWHASPAQVTAGVNAHLRALGIDGSCHRLRHAYASSVYRRSGGDLLLTQRLLGHASVATTQIYAEPADVAARVVGGLLDDAA